MILVTGALGQVGIDLVQTLRKTHGSGNVLTTDLHHKSMRTDENTPFVSLDVTDRTAIDHILEEYPIHTVFHLAGILSARGETDPDQCWNVNVNGLRNMLEVATKHGVRMFWPSSIAAFGSHTPRVDTPQATVTDPSTMYGITKVAGELLCQYYAEHHGVDVRSIRFPGIISYSAPPGGGTTDFAVDMFFKAVESSSYTCFVSEDTRLPMMYMPDAVKSILDLMNADAENITVRTSYNVSSFSFSAGELAEAIAVHLPAFTCRYKPDFRQQIADSWPMSVDDSRARQDWDWKPEYELEDMVQDMIEQVRLRSSANQFP